MPTNNPEHLSSEVVTDATNRLQAWLDADDATHFGQHEKDIQTLLDALTASRSACGDGEQVERLRAAVQPLIDQANRADSNGHWGAHLAQITLDDCRAVRAAIEANK